MTQIIAEVASNHGGDRALMIRFIESCAKAGADVVKFQSYQTKHLSREDPQYSWLERAELTDGDHTVLLEACRACGVQFLTTAFSADRLPFLRRLGLTTIKIGSGESARLVPEAVKVFPSVYASCGLWDSEPMAWPLSVVPFHTVSLYPTPPTQACLGRLEQWEGPVGYSDHTEGLDICEVALTMDLVALEVHVCLPGQPRPCQPWEKTMAELEALVKYRDWLTVIMGTAAPDLSIPYRRFHGRWA